MGRRGKERSGRPGSLPTPTERLYAQRRVLRFGRVNPGETHGVTSPIQADADGVAVDHPIHHAGYEAEVHHFMVRANRRSGLICTTGFASRTREWSSRGMRYPLPYSLGAEWMVVAFHEG